MWQPDVPGLISKDYGHGNQSGPSRSRPDFHKQSSNSKPPDTWEHSNPKDSVKAANAVKFLAYAFYSEVSRRLACPFRDEHFAAYISCRVAALSPRVCSSIGHIIRAFGVPEDVLLDLPKDLLKQFEFDYCHLCDFNCVTNRYSKMHYLSKAHRNKTRTWLVEWSRDTSAPSVILDGDQLRTFQPRDVYCELCEVQITSQALFESHYTGSKHKNTVLGRKEPRNDKLKLPENKDRLKRLIEREMRILEISSPEDTEQTMPKRSGRSYVLPEFWCEICGVAVTSGEHMVIHMNGKKHLAKEKEHILRITRCEDEPVPLTRKDRIKLLLDSVKSENLEAAEGDEATEDGVGPQDSRHEPEQDVTVCSNHSTGAENSTPVEQNSVFSKEEAKELGDSFAGQTASFDQNHLCDTSLDENNEILNELADLLEENDGEDEGDEGPEDNNENQQESLAPRDVYCELCDVEITSKALHEAHYLGRQHKNTVIKHRRPRNIQLLQPENITRLNKLLQREMVIMGLEYMKEDVVAIPSTTQPDPTLNQGAVVSKGLYCSICKVKPKTDQQMAAHLGGKKHQANVLTQAKAVDETEDESPPPTKRKRVTSPPPAENNAYKENGEQVTMVECTENESLVPGSDISDNDLEEGGDEYFQRLCAAIDSTRTMEQLQDDSLVRGKAEPSVPPEEPPRVSRYNPAKIQSEVGKVESEDGLSSSDSSNSDMDIDSS